MTLSETVQRNLRRELRQAVYDGVIGGFSLRPGGRATIYAVEGGVKWYTTSTLETLAMLSRLRDVTV